MFCFSELKKKTKGFNGGKQDYYTKENGGGSESYLDFWEDLEISRDYSDDYSTDQYFDILIDILNDHADSNNAVSEDPFFVYLALQTVHDPFPTYSSESDESDYYKQCISNYESTFSSFDDRIGVCECMVGVDYQMGRLMRHFESTDELKDIWDNTIIIFTSDNGGSIDDGSCNYPLRGGKNTFYDGGIRVIAAGTSNHYLFCPLISFLFTCFAVF